MEIIRSGFSVEGVRLMCECRDGSFIVESRWQSFHASRCIHEALVVFEGLCLEDYPTKQHAVLLVREARRIRRSRMTSNAAWERRVIECARRRAEGLRVVIGGSKGGVEAWVPA